MPVYTISYNGFNEDMNLYDKAVMTIVRVNPPNHIHTHPRYSFIIIHSVCILLYVIMYIMALVCECALAVGAQQYGFVWVCMCVCVCSKMSVHDFIFLLFSDITLQWLIQTAKNRRS